MKTLICTFCAILLLAGVVSAASQDEAQRIFNAKYPGHQFLTKPILALTVETGDTTWLSCAFLPKSPNNLIMMALEPDGRFVPKAIGGSRHLIEMFVDTTECLNAIEMQLGFRPASITLLYCGARNTITCMDCLDYGRTFWCFKNPRGEIHFLLMNMSIQAQIHFDYPCSFCK